MKILVVEDESKVLTFLRKGLSSSEISTDTASNLSELFSNLLSVHYDAIVLDRLLGGVDSMGYIPEIKKKAPHTRIIILSALSDVDEKVDGLASGADDYVGKPFHLAELIARLRAVCRRHDAHSLFQTNTLQLKDLRIHLDTQKIERAGKRIDLTAKEYKLIVFLVRKPNRIYSKAEILNAVWELEHYPESNVVEVVITHLRSKIDKGFDTALIHSKRGGGYWAGDKEA